MELNTRWDKNAMDLQTICLLGVKFTNSVSMTSRASGSLPSLTAEIKIDFLESCVIGYQR